MIYQLMPVACLMATLFTLSGLSRSNELTALFSVGTSLTRVSARSSRPSPSFVPGGVRARRSGVAAFDAAAQLRRVRRDQKTPGLYSTVKTNKIWYRSENILFNIKTLNPETARAQGITLYYFDPNGI